jgi:hypothetical protein
MATARVAATKILFYTVSIKTGGKTSFFTACFD